MERGIYDLLDKIKSCRRTERVGNGDVIYNRYQSDVGDSKLSIVIPVSGYIDEDGMFKESIINTLVMMENRVSVFDSDGVRLKSGELNTSKDEFLTRYYESYDIKNTLDLISEIPTAKL